MLNYYFSWVKKSYCSEGCSLENRVKELESGSGKLESIRKDILELNSRLDVIVIEKRQFRLRQFIKD